MHVPLLCLAACDGQIRYCSSSSPDVLKKVIISQRRWLCDGMDSVCDPTFFVPVQSTEQKLYDVCVEGRDRLLDRLSRVQVCGYLYTGKHIGDIAETCDDSSSQVFVFNDSLVLVYKSSAVVLHRVSPYAVCTHADHQLHGSPNERDIFWMMLHEHVHHVAIIADPLRELRDAPTGLASCMCVLVALLRNGDSIQDLWQACRLWKLSSSLGIPFGVLFE